ncbi:MAG TPA: 23S rRNA (guanosine(2251)-2'-O)-methyltransferase RlmB [Clostridia bacterium]|nr:23S rRNA (guanosine(2251)-2'-O)-methyltransferase RlmB [Clostridia bacterium]
MYGRNPIREAIKAGRQLDKLFVVKDIDPSGMDITCRAREQGVPVVYVHRAKLDKLTAGAAHQGVAAFIAARKYSELEDILQIAREKGEPPFILIADGIEDPHNLGAIIRTAECAGMHGVIIRKRHACGLTSVVDKVSAGALEHMAVARVNNIAAFIEDLKNQGIWIAGADMAGDPVYNANLKGALAIVVGAEGKGLSMLVAQKCDFLISLPQRGLVGSLNVSSAAAAIIYEALRQRIFSQ